MCVWGSLLVVAMFEYCCFTCLWLGQGLTQEISHLYQKKTELKEWKGRYWIDFINQIAQQGWEIETILPFSNGLEEGAIAYFKRPLNNVP